MVRMKGGGATVFHEEHHTYAPKDGVLEIPEHLVAQAESVGWRRMAANEVSAHIDAQEEKRGLAMATDLQKVEAAAERPSGLAEGDLGEGTDAEKARIETEAADLEDFSADERERYHALRSESTGFDHDNAVITILEDRERAAAAAEPDADAPAPEPEPAAEPEPEVERRSADQDAAVEEAFVSGTLPEEDRRAPEEPSIDATEPAIGDVTQASGEPHTEG